jgi:hypothetical protein
MSGIYFHSLDGETRVRGNERAMFGCYCSDLMLLALKWVIVDTVKCPSPLRKVLPADSYVLGRHPEPVVEYDWQPSGFKDDVELWLKVPYSRTNKLVLGDKEVEPFAMSLNTALVVGSDPVKLGARLHGQCELHAYIEGENRPWMAAIVQDGLSSGFLRDDMGWESVIDLLQAGADHPVVTSYSVCEQFPNWGFADDFEAWDDDDAERIDALREQWWGLPSEVQWGQAMPNLRESGGGLEMKPENWESFYFHNGINAYQFAREVAALT